ncbi:MAG: Wzz/FepE/Etk N-terminal domain-containing protein [Ignavibacteriales bacterium]|nr:Wzz/FepE/Etk N-terminal domain-containing protein [Ignavibacteriales bacterium]
MEKEFDNKKSAKISDYLYILFKWKKFLIINMFIVIIAATIYAFLIQQEYKATAVVMIPQESSMGLGGLTGLLSNKSTANIGSKLLGVSRTDEDVLLGILNSRTSLTNAIKKFNLMKYYEIDDKNMDKALKAFSGNLSFGPNEYSMIEISVTNKSPELSAAIANYFTDILDSINIFINIEQAKNNRKFVEQRYFKNLIDIRNAEDSMYRFQKKYGIFAVPEQLEVAVKAAGEIEAQLTSKEMEQYFMKQLYGEKSPQSLGMQTQIDMLKTKVLELKNGDKLSSVSNVLFPFKGIPNITMQYLRHFREVEIQSKILEVILPLYEQAKVEEQKSVPTIIRLDKAVPPQLKDSPKKGFIIISISFLGLFFFALVVFKGESSITRKEFRNPLQEKETKIYLRLVKIYRLKI